MALVQAYSSPFGVLTIWVENGSVIKIDLPNSVSNFANIAASSDPQDLAVMKDCIRQLDDYFGGKLQTFSLPLNPCGTAFQQRVWEQLTLIPYGETISYSELALRSGSPRGARAAGMACHNNPIPIVIPCHRVIGKNGSLTGFGGGLNLKEKLIDLEVRNKHSNS